MSGVRSSAATVAAAEKTVKQVARTVADDIIPGIKEKAPLAKCRHQTLSDITHFSRIVGLLKLMAFVPIP